jgi:hypothetical protein
MTITISTASELRLLARKHVHTAIATMIGIMTSEKVAPNVRLSAAGMLVDRAFGRVPLMTTGEAAEAALRITEIVTTIVDPKVDDGAPMLLDEACATAQLAAPDPVAASHDGTSDEQ